MAKNCKQRQQWLPSRSYMKLPKSKSSQTTTEVALTALVCLAQQSKPTVPALLLDSDSKKKNVMEEITASEFLFTTFEMLTDLLRIPG